MITMPQVWRLCCPYFSHPEALFMVVFVLYVVYFLCDGQHRHAARILQVISSELLSQRETADFLPGTGPRHLWCYSLASFELVLVLVVRVSGCQCEP